MFDDRSPIYRQIAEQIEADVLRGTLRGDEQVMSTTKYAAFHRINPATVAKAFQQLVDDGVLYKRRGIGMFVSPDAPEALRERRRKSFFADVVEPMVTQARTLGIPLSDLVQQITELSNKDIRP
ncbi:GntR family transcriptional regulator [Actinophytocola gossypii]|uniref:GntR family transcriptional regulator n=1 Tax=Actinophytocola gossypii TaxID=2812003 RepID=A0ABT2JES7_9PSEU|nr:GntR family transcriptional regulator [Actinophytocola gossypii]MCT2586378.1 GntR family transcriptional regulator [Actinophytocola gossypii]